MVRNVTPRLILLLALLVVSSPAQAEEFRGAALLVGVDHYDHFARLHFAGRDAAALGQILGGDFGLKVTVLNQELAKQDPKRAPDARRVRTELKLLVEAANPADTVVFVFSGHGEQEAGGKDICLVLADSNMEDPLSRLTLSELYAAFAGCKAGQKLLILDACRRVSTGDRIDENRPDRPKVDNKTQVPPPPPGVVVLLSCAPDEVSLEAPIFAHGLFTHFLVAELRRAVSQGEPLVSADLAAAVTRPTVDLTTRRFGVAQTPQRLAQGAAEVTLRVPAAGHLKTGLAAARQWHWKKAEEAFSKGLTEAPQSARLLAERAQVRAYRGQMVEAPPDAREAVRLAPDYPPALNARAVVQVYRGELKAAHETSDRAIRLDPRVAATYLTRSWISGEQGDWARALEDAEQAVRLDPDWAEAVLQRGNARDSLNFDDLAAADARRVLVLRPTLAQALFLLAQVTESRSGRAEAETFLEQALAGADEALVDDPENLSARLDHISALRRLRKYKEAEKAAQQAVADHPDSGYARTSLGSVRAAAGQHAQAVADFTVAARLLPELAGILVARSRARRSSFDRPGAAADLDAAIKLAPLDPGSRWQRAALLQEEDSTAALAECDWVVAHYPGHWYAYVARARVFRHLGDPERCLEDLNTAARLGPTEPYPHTEIGEVLHSLGRLDDAVAQFDRAIKLAPRSPAGYYARGWTHVARKDFDKAVADFQMAVDRDPENVYLYNGLGFALYQVGRYQDVLDKLTRAVERGSTDANVYLYRGLASIQLGDVNFADLSRHGRLVNPEDESSLNGAQLVQLLLASASATDVDYYDRLVKWAPDNFLFYYLRARVHSNARRFDLALANADVIAKLHPTSPLVHVVRGDIFARRGELDKALAECDQAIKIAPRQGRLYFNRARVQVLAEKRELALADLRKAVELNPKHDEAFNQMGILLFMDQQWDDALAAFSRAIELDPMDGAYWSNRARTRFDRGGSADARLAEKDYTQAIKLAPEHRESYADRGKVRLALNDNEGAIADLTTVLEGDPKDAASRNRRGIAYLRIKRPDLALKDLDEAVRLAPDKAIILANRGQAHLALKAFDAALDDYRAARKRNPKNEELAEDLADVLVARGKDRLIRKEWEGAVADLDEALNLRPKQVEALLARGDAQRARKAFDLARKDYTAAVEVKEDPLPLAKRGLLAAARGDQTAATADFDKVYELARGKKPALGSGPAEELVAAAYASRGGARQEEVDALERVLKAEPGVGYLHWRRGKAYTALKEYDAAVEELTRAIDQGFRRPQVFADRARVLNDRRGKDDLSRSLADANRAVQLDPKLLTAHKEKAYAHLKLKEYDKAIEAATAALNLAENDEEAFQIRADAWHWKQDWAKAAEEYTRVLSVNPNDARCLSRRGFARSKLGNNTEAEADYSKAIELNPKNPMYWDDRGFVRIQLGKFDEAARDLEQALELDPTNPSPHKNLGLAALKQKNYGIALQRLTRAIELDRDNAEAFQLRAEVYQAIGEPLKAEADKKKAADLAALASKR